MDSFKPDPGKIDEYTKAAKEKWGNTPAYQEFEEKNKNRTQGEQQKILAGMMGIFVEFGSVKNGRPDSEEARSLVKKLQDYITEHFYQCTDTILYGLGKMYGSGGEFTTNIDQAAGEGTARFASEAIEVYCGKDGARRTEE